MKAGFIAVVGRPNVGKSTLINKLVSEKVAIVSDKAGTMKWYNKKRIRSTGILQWDVKGFWHAF